MLTVGCQCSVGVYCLAKVVVRPLSAFHAALAHTIQLYRHTYCRWKRQWHHEIKQVTMGCSRPPHMAVTASPEEQRSHALCPVCAVHTYKDKTGSFRRSDQVFIFWACPHKVRPVTKLRLGRWVVKAITLAFTSQGLQPPEGLRAFSTDLSDADLSMWCKKGEWTIDKRVDSHVHMNIW